MYEMQELFKSYLKKIMSFKICFKIFGKSILLYNN